MIKEIFLGDRLISYDLQKKKVKNVNIRIKNDLTVHVSAPARVSQKQIEEILLKRAEFILSALQKYEKRFEKARKHSNSEADTVVLFAESLPVTVTEGKRNKAEINKDGVFVTLKDTNDSAARKKAIDSALDAILRETVDELCRRVSPQFEKYIPCFPKIKYKRMKSRWGSCNYKKYILTFNYHLVRAPLDCVEYVVYHEFTHFIHPNHSKAFYFELSRYVPDYTEKKKRLGEVIIN